MSCLELSIHRVPQIHCVHIFTSLTIPISLQLIQYPVPVIIIIQIIWYSIPVCITLQVVRYSVTIIIYFFPISLIFVILQLILVTISWYRKYPSPTRNTLITGVVKNLQSQRTNNTHNYCQTCRTHCTLANHSDQFVKE